MRNFDYDEFERAINEQFHYIDFEEAIEDMFQPMIDGTTSKEEWEDLFKMVEEYFDLECLDMVDDERCRKIIVDAAEEQIGWIREICC